MTPKRVNKEAAAPESALIECLYDAAVDPVRWTGMARRIADAFESTSAVLKVHAADARVRLIEATENLAIASKDQAWADHWHRNDLWVERSAALGMSRVVVSHELLEQREFEQTGFYQEWNRRLNIYHMVGAVFPIDSDTMGVLGIHRPRRGGAYASRDQRRVARFLPHLTRALRLTHQFSQASTAQRLSLAALDHLRTGVIVLDENCRLLHANKCADAVLRSQKHMRTRGGRFELDNRELDARLKRCVREAVSTAGGMPEAPASALVLRRPSQLPITILVRPLRNTWDASSNSPPAAVVFIGDPELATPPVALLRELFGLTPTEAAIASALGEGLAPGQIAVSFGIGLATVRSHLKMILAKTGTHRQAQLVSLLSQSVALVAVDYRAKASEAISPK